VRHIGRLGKGDGDEDAALFYARQLVGQLPRLGVAEQGTDWRACCGLHSSHMHLDESAMVRGAALHAAIAERFLAEGLA
jgi:hippurate hydrolase